MTDLAVGEFVELTDSGISQGLCGVSNLLCKKTYTDVVIDVKDSLVRIKQDNRKAPASWYAKTFWRKRQVEEYKKRVVDEKKQLAERTSKLGGFLESCVFDELSKEEQTLLKRQHHHMVCYTDLLRQRIDMWAT